MIPRLEILDELNLFLGVATGHGYHRAAEALRPVMGTETSREKPIAVCDLHDIAAARPPPARMRP